jgi:serine/threonine protein kinase
MIDTNEIAMHRAHVLTAGAILQSRYRIGQRLGEGGMGAVYEATDLRLNHIVAIKQIVTTNEGLWRQFKREAHLLARLNHPALPRVSDYFTEGNCAFFVMQFVDGADLAEMIDARRTPFPRNQVIAWADQLLDALMYLHSHERQIIHRDIKPHNLKINSIGHVTLLDFGLAKSRITDLCADQISSTSVFGYTPRYAPLEQIQDLGTTPQSDIYALGATLYHLLTGLRPPDAVTRAAAFVSERPNPLRPANEINSAIGPELSSILDRAMSQNADDRYASAKEFREALRQIGRNNNHDASIHPYLEGPSTKSPGDIEVRDECTQSPKFSARMVAAFIVILLTAFGVFCHYYHWNVPRLEMTGSVLHGQSEQIAPRRDPATALIGLKESAFRPTKVGRRRSGS